jgi:hypothetical protein
MRTVERRGERFTAGLAADFVAAARLVAGALRTAAFSAAALLGPTFGVVDFLGMARPRVVVPRKGIRSLLNRQHYEGYLGHVERENGILREKCSYCDQSKSWAAL